MKKLALIIIELVLALNSFASPRSPNSEELQDNLSTKTVPPIKLSITSAGLMGPMKTRFRAGEPIVIAITMTNTSNEPMYVCISNPLYQDLPQLSRDGQVMPYMKWQAYELETSAKNGTCVNESLPEPALLKPNEPTLVDWFILCDDGSLGADSWFDPLAPGRYELSLQRRINCCDGPLIQSNKISFDVVQQE